MLAEVLRAAASPLRLRLLHRLSGESAAVSDLAAELGVSQPLMSHHLAILRGAGLVSAVRSGRSVAYRIADSPLAWSIVGVVRQHLGGDEADPLASRVAVPHGDHVDLSAAGRFLRLDEKSGWVDCEPVGHAVHRVHPHRHGSGCGHVGVPHRDHVDYVHDGHRHAVHGDHYDDH